VSVTTGRVSRIDVNGVMNQILFRSITGVLTEVL
jgi:hypothetical protein